MESVEKNLGVSMSTSKLCDALVILLENSGYIITKDKHQCDFYLVINTDTEHVGNNNGLYSSKLFGEYVLYQRDGVVLFRKTLLPVLGTQLSYKSAGEIAYREIIQNLRNRMLYDLEMIFNQI